MHFSKRTAWEPGENAWAERLHEYQRAGADLVDLTASNPIQCGLGPSEANVLEALSDSRGLRYQPDPFGMMHARESVCDYYRSHGAELPPEQLCLTTSTSEAYSYLFRLLCDSGDEVLIAQPSYPLFDLLARLDDVVLRGYPLRYEAGAGRHGRWWIDFDALEKAIGPQTRAVLVVHPNNPTGSYVSKGEQQALQRLCARHDLALIVDEVFLDYPLAAQEDGAQSFAAEPDECLCFVLSGISKVCALPQMKLSWLAAVGPAPLVAEAMRRLEVVADTFLSVNAPMQYALRSWLAARHATQKRIRQRCAGNLSQLDAALLGSVADRLSVQGGWTAVLRTPAFVEGEAFCLAALRRGVVVQPGDFYGLSAGHCVVSLLTPPELWERGLARLPIRG